MNELEIIRRLVSFGAIITNDHFVFASGRHAETYVNKDAMYPHTSFTADLCREMAQRISREVDVVIAPAVGAIVLSQWVAYFLSDNDREIHAVYADKNGDEFVVRRGYDRYLMDKRTLVVEDNLTTGRSVRKVMKAARSHGANIVGVSVLWNRGGVTTEDLKVSFLEALVSVTLRSWTAEECELCRQGIPINTDVGKGREFLEKRGM